MGATLHDTNISIEKAFIEGVSTFFPIKSAVGSCRKVSRTVMSASSFCRNSPRLISQVFRKGPEYKDVNLKGLYRKIKGFSTVIAIGPERVDHILGQTEWD